MIRIIIFYFNSNSNKNEEFLELKQFSQQSPANSIYPAMLTSAFAKISSNQKLPSVTSGK
jgi:hypothetical protein